MADLMTSLHRRAAQAFARRPVSLPPGFPPTVSFTFDDFPESAVANGLPILGAAGMAATWYAATGLLGGPSPSGIVASADRLGDLQAAGHEIGDHTFGHLDARTVSSADYARDVAANRAALARAVPGLRLRSFAYPYGRVTLGAKRAASAGALTCRGTRAGIARGTIDLAMLPANALYTRANPRIALEPLIGAAARAGGWLILYTHDVTENPSPWGCTPADLAAIVAQVRRAGLRVATMGDVGAELGEPRLRGAAA